MAGAQGSHLDCGQYSATRAVQAQEPDGKRRPGAAESGEWGWGRGSSARTGSYLGQLPSLSAARAAPDTAGKSAAETEDGNRGHRRAKLLPVGWRRSRQGSQPPPEEARSDPPLSSGGRSPAHTGLLSLRWQVAASHRVPLLPTVWPRSPGPAASSRGLGCPQCGEKATEQGNSVIPRVPVKTHPCFHVEQGWERGAVAGARCK